MAVKPTRRNVPGVIGARARVSALQSRAPDGVIRPRKELKSVRLGFSVSAMAAYASCRWWDGFCGCDPYVLLPKPDLRYPCFMIRLPILKDELAFLEKLRPDLETRPDLGHLASDIKKRIDKIQQEIRALLENK